MIDYPTDDSFRSEPSLNRLLALTSGVTMDEGVIKLPLWVKRVRLDIGLSICAPQSELWLREQPNDLMVFGFEPNPLACKQILGEAPYENDWQVKLDPSRVGDSFVLIPCALGSKNTSVPLYITEIDQGRSSVYVPNDFNVVRTEFVPMFTLEIFLGLLPTIVEYVKIDAQGSDLDIIKGARDQLAQKVIYITAECEQSQYKNTMNSETELSKYIEAQGFVRVKHPRTVDPTFINKRFFHLMNDISILQVS